MGPSLTLAAYRAYVRRSTPQTYSPCCEHPGGELIWAHATSTERMAALVDIGGRLANLRGNLQFLITFDPEINATKVMQPTGSSNGACLIEALPSDHPSAVDHFLDHWGPDICLWSGGYLRPNLILETATRDIPMFLIDASNDGFDSRKERWFPEVSRHLLTKFSEVMAQSTAARHKLIRLGLPANDVVKTPPLRAGGQLPLVCDLDDLDKASDHLSGRPIWLAADVQREEIDQILRAHRQAARMAHRLLLILIPANETKDLAAMITAENFRVANWSDGALPDEQTQVLIATSTDELGLWYRLAPLAFIGSSLVSGYGGRNPFTAAALGAAILYGPNVGDHLDAYSRLAAAGAARIVKDSDGLGTAVLRLTAPDLAASMAHAGWEVVSEGAEQTDKVIQLVQSVLDNEEAT